MRRILGLVALSLASCGGNPSPPPVVTPASSASAVAAPPPPVVPTSATVCFQDQRLENGVCVVGSCPLGTSLRGDVCVATASVTCPAGMRFDTEDACVAIRDAPELETGYRVAMAAFRAWRGNGAKVGTGVEARGKAFAALSSFHEKHANDPLARVYLVEITHDTAYLLRVAEEKGADIWTRKALEAFAALRAASKENLVGTRAAEQAALMSLALVDAEAWTTFDYETGHLRYGDRAAQVTQQLDTALVDAEKLTKKLEPLTKQSAHGSARVAAEALARQGSLWDSIRISVQRIRVEGPDTDALRRIRDRGGLEKQVIHGYAEAIALATRFQVKTPPLAKAWQRLAELDEEVGPEKMRAGTAGIDRVRYVPGMWKAPMPGSEQ